MNFKEDSTEYIDQHLMYEFHAKDLSQTEALKQFSDHVVKEIKSTTDWDCDVQITIEPVAKDKKLFSVSMSLFGLGYHPIVVKKEGKDPMGLLRKVRKTVLRQIHSLGERRIRQRKKQILYQGRHRFRKQNSRPSEWLEGAIAG